MSHQTNYEQIYHYEVFWPSYQELSADSKFILILLTIIYHSDFLTSKFFYRGSQRRVIAAAFDNQPSSLSLGTSWYIPTWLSTKHVFYKGNTNLCSLTYQNANIHTSMRRSNIQNVTFCRSQSAIDTHEQKSG